MNKVMYDSDRHHRRSIRLKGYDYTQPGAYFVTLATWQKVCWFGEIVDGAMRLNAAGRLVHAEWQHLTHHFPNIRLGAFVVMPNHVHGIIIIDHDGTTDIVGATRPLPDNTLEGKDPGPDQALVGIVGSPLQPQPPPARDNHDGSPLHASVGGSPGQSVPQPTARPNGPPAGSLGAMIGQFKSRATKRIWGLPGADRHPVWQHNYYEHIIRQSLEYEHITQYIQANPLRWQVDQLLPSVPPNRYEQE